MTAALASRQSPACGNAWSVRPCGSRQIVAVKKCPALTRRKTALAHALAEGLSLIKFSALLVAAAVAIGALSVTLTRLALFRRTRDRWDTAWKGCGGDAVSHLEHPPVIPPPVIEKAAGKASRPLATQEWWQGLATGSHARWAQGFVSPSDWCEGSTGVCVSGGGVRSASVTLGALQALRENGELGRARYLVSVSGGGYMVGGFQLAMTRQSDDSASVSRACPSDAFDPGSPEEDHLRRHSSYIADSLGRWLEALGVLLRGVASSLVIIGLTVNHARGSHRRVLPSHPDRGRRGPGPAAAPVHDPRPG
jgi:hypothetical protein